MPLIAKSGNKTVQTSSVKGPQTILGGDQPFEGFDQSEKWSGIRIRSGVNESVTGLDRAGGVSYDGFRLFQFGSFLTPVRSNAWKAMFRQPGQGNSMHGDRRAFCPFPATAGKRVSQRLAYSIQRCPIYDHHQRITTFRRATSRLFSITTSKYNPGERWSRLTEVEFPEMPETNRTCFPLLS